MVWDPFEDMRRLRKEMDKVFENFFKRSEIRLLEQKGKKAIEPFKSLLREPLSDVVEKDNEVEIRIDLQGIDKKDIILSVTENNVEIRAEKKHEVKEEKKGFFREERSYRGFHRIIPLPCDVRAEDSKAEYKKGVLKITVPKKIVEKKIAKKIIVK